MISVVGEKISVRPQAIFPKKRLADTDEGGPGMNEGRPVLWIFHHFTVFTETETDPFGRFSTVR
ncbi:hypothetical protein [Varunaivibrio sulfuroxidans]|uniref:hypothetical protein n=1 Tax=Varunaivibrio sulfuroxidans TaxID=1773489 RepID=UPI001048F079|nr:hypothetical protein [Varunaivibrio sulfuroxidans]WES30064.1 hypothetical protein P3M64_10500 [Varunaivibrio sulfuroxidans]